MKKLFINIGSQIGVLASLLGLAYTLRPTTGVFSGWQYLLIFISILLFIVYVIFEIYEYCTNGKLTFSNPKSIRNYMFKWIKSSGNTVIFTRDLSWVNDEEMREMLRTKSQNHELIICLPNRIERVEEFEIMGATIIEYSQIQYTPTSRFTIKNFGRNDAMIAVGQGLENNKHLIEEYKNGEHPYFHVANDLVKMLYNYSQNN